MEWKDVTSGEFQHGNGREVLIRWKVCLEAFPNGLPLSVSPEFMLHQGLPFFTTDATSLHAAFRRPLRSGPLFEGKTVNCTLNTIFALTSIVFSN
jgi:hypothetical protein